MCLNSIEEINRSKKEINRLLSKGISNIYLIQNFDVLSLKRFVSRSVVGEIQFNFQTTCKTLNQRPGGKTMSDFSNIVF